MPHAFIGIGSNIAPEDNVRAAIRSLARKTRLAAISTVYLTAALGRPDQPPYYNCVVEAETDLPPGEMKFGVLRGIESELGRQRTADKYAPRTIDLDLLVYGDLVLEADGIRLPDPEILVRPFLAVPLSELAPDLVLAGYDLRIDDIVAPLARGGMQALRDYTESLREELLG